MKKLLYITFAIFMTLFASCSQDSGSSGNGGGGNVTGKKISSIYYDYTYYGELSSDYGQTWEVSNNYHESYKDSDWTWDNNKLMQITKYNENNNVRRTIRFEYNNNQITRFIEESDETFTIVDLIYSANRIVKINCTNNGIQGPIWSLIYNASGKLYRMTLDYWPMKDVLPQETGLSKLLTRKHGNTKEGDEYIELEWSGDNVRKITYHEDNDIDYETYLYDSYNNPYYDVHQLFGLMIDDLCTISRNNCIKVIADDGIIVEYSYNYYDNYPMQQIYVYEYTGNEGQQYQWRSTSTTKYSYNYMN